MLKIFQNFLLKGKIKQLYFVSILENFSGKFSGDFSDLPTLPTLPTFFSLFLNEEGVLTFKAAPRISWMHKQPLPTGQIKQSRSGIRVNVPS